MFEHLIPLFQHLKRLLISLVQLTTRRPPFLFIILLAYHFLTENVSKKDEQACTRVYFIRPRGKGIYFFKGDDDSKGE